MTSKRLLAGFSGCSSLEFDAVGAEEVGEVGEEVGLGVDAKGEAHGFFVGAEDEDDLGESGVEVAGLF